MKTLSSLSLGLSLIAVTVMATACGSSKSTSATSTASNDSCFNNNNCNVDPIFPTPTPDPTSPPDPPNPPSPNAPNGTGNNSPPGNTGTNNGNGNGNGTGNGNSFASDVKDVDLQRADVEAKNEDDRARALADHFQMSLDSARSLTKLSDQLSRLQKGAGGGLTDEDREALSKSALAVAGVPPEEVNAAVAKLIQDGDRQPVDELIDRGAANLGMPSSSGLRDQILPSLGISF